MPALQSEGAPADQTFFSVSLWFDISPHKASTEPINAATRVDHKGHDALPSGRFSAFDHLQQC